MSVISVLLHFFDYVFGCKGNRYDCVGTVFKSISNLFEHYVAIVVYCYCSNGHAIQKYRTGPGLLALIIG